MNTLTSQIRKAIRASGISPTDLARKIGTAPTTIITFMQGLSGINLRTADKIARVLNLEIVELEPRPVFHSRPQGRPRTRPRSNNNGEARQ